MTEQQARERNGAMLVVASLGPWAKNGSKQSGDLVVRLLFDGTHRVPVTKRILCARPGQLSSSTGSQQSHDATSKPKEAQCTAQYQQTGKGQS